ncbi:MAG: hypothetical protein J6B68_10205 [Lachnospiraceae bacterium]|nr:hypothetical protein [Lachnospiraceae bacterium]
MENRPKMDRAERAKQFMPFAALKGYEEALREREKQAEKKMSIKSYKEQIK